MLRQDPDYSPGRPEGAMFPGTSKSLYTRVQAGAQTLSHGGVCGCTEGGLHEVQDQPQEGQEARRQEVVLHSVAGVRTCLM